MANTSILAAFERMWQHVVAALGNKSDKDHTHNDIYYTESEVDAKLSEVNSSISSITNGDVAVAKAEEATHAISADTATSATSATKATKDGSGNTITSTYETKTDASVKLTEAKTYTDTEVAKKADKTHNHDTLYDAKGSASDALAESKEYTDTVASGKANASHSHSISNVTNLQSSLDGKVPTSRTVNGKALTANITLSASDVGAATSTHTHDGYVNQNAFSNVKVGSTTVAADTTTDTLEIAAGTGISVSGDATNDKVTITNSGVRSIGTGSSNGTISVNTGGTTADVAVKGLGSAAYTNSSAYDAAGKADTALASAKSYTDTKISNLINSAPTTLDTLGEIATAMEENADIVEALESAIGTKADKTHSHAISDVSGLQSALDGKAASSHGTHVSYSTTAPKMDGTASAGSASTVARTDHVHPTDTSRASKSEFDSHVADITKHITSTERTNWGTAYTHSQAAHAPSNAEKNQNAFSNVKIGDTTIAADTTTDTLTLVGSNVTLTPDATNDKVTIAVADGSTSTKGIVKLTDSTSSTSTTTAATPKNVKAAYDLANIAKTNAATAQTRADSAYSLAESKANASHTHDDRYYTETEIDNKLSGKAASSHTHTIANVTNLQSTLDAKALQSDLDALETVVAGKFTEKTITTATDLDTIKTSGIYHINVSGCTNAPTSNHATLFVDFTVGTPYQIFIPDNVSDCDYKRNCTQGVWGEWVKRKFTNTTYTLGSFGVTATKDELNKLDGVTATTTELNYVDGVTSSIQTQLDGKAASSHKHTVSQISDLTATATELNYMDGVTSNVQTQLDGKASSGHTHNYAGSSSAGGAATSANKVNSSLTVKLNGGTTEGTNLFTFNGSAAKAINITPSAIGAAASSHNHDDRYYTESEVDTKLSGKANTSHGNHVPATQTASNKVFLRNDNTWATVTPANIGAAESSHTHNYAGSSSAGGSANSAVKWSTARNINGMSVDGSADRVNYGTCSTAAGTAAKTVACTGFALVTGAEITVKFTVSNSADNPTLNVNSTGAKPIFYRGAAITKTYLVANRTYTFRYDGTNWDFVGDINVDTNTDTKVTQTNTTSSGDYRVLFSGTADDTSRAESARKSSKLKFNPNTGTLTATALSGSLAPSNLSSAVPVNKGGTGATDAATALANLGGAKASETIKTAFYDDAAENIGQLLDSKCAHARELNTPTVCIYGGWQKVDYGVFYAQVVNNVVNGIYVKGDTAYIVRCDNGTNTATYHEISTSDDLNAYLPLSGGSVGWLQTVGDYSHAPDSSAFAGCQVVLNASSTNVNNGHRAGLGFHNNGMNGAFLYFDDGRFKMIDNAGNISTIAKMDGNFNFAPTDLNEATSFGCYRMQEGHLNTPEVPCNYSQLFVCRGEGDTLFQIIVEYGNGQMYVRGSSAHNNPNGSWSSWRKVVYSDDLAGVSATANAAYTRANNCATIGSQARYSGINIGAEGKMPYIYTSNGNNINFRYTDGNGNTAYKDIDGMVMKNMFTVSGNDLILEWL